MSSPARNELRLLLIEDESADAELVIRQLRRAGITFTSHRVETEVALRAALRDFTPTVVLSDFTLPQFDGLSALKIVRELAPEVPFIFVSGTIGEERAIEALRHGATDYVLKSNVSRVAPAIERAAVDAEARAERARQQAQIARLTRVLRMLSGINSVVPRANDRGELLREACRLAVDIGSYAAATVLLKHWSRGIEPVASAGVDEDTTDAFRSALEASAPRKSSIVGRVLEEATPFVCNDTVDLVATVTLNETLIKASLRSLVALPLIVDKTAVGVLALAARDIDVVSDEELGMLREVAGNLSFALQYLHKDTTVKFLSHFDTKTGLAKRSLFCQRLAGVLKDAERRRTRHGVAIIDIERLSLINDSFGRHTGDLLLQHVADRLKRRFQQNDQLAHIGGGTFALMRDVTARSTEDLLPAIQDHIAAVFGAPFVIEGREIPVTVRCGLTLFPDHGKNADALVQNAEAALRNARASGERHLRYSAERHTEAVARLALEHKLRRALDRKEFELHYQPKVNVKSRRIEGLEALLRWRDPETELVPPAVFLPLLESTGLIVDVGEWIYQQAAEDCQYWQGLGLPPIRVAVNISPIQLRRADFVPSFLQATQSWATAALGLDIEITEGVLQDDAEPEIRKLMRLREAGVKIAIDDFGTGYSSLSRISTLPVDTLKIDRSFIRELPHKPSARTLVRTIISLARAFEMSVTAEGVETTEQLDVLWEMDCDQSQGFLHSIPVHREECAQLLKYGKGRVVLPAAPVDPR